MPRTSIDHSVPTPLLGSVLCTAAAPPGAPDAASPPAAPLRRVLLSGSVAALALATGSAVVAGARPTSPDVGLVALCARLDQMQHRIDALFPEDWCGMNDAGLEAADAAACLLEAEQRPVLDQLCTLTPVTIAGCTALARSTVSLRPDLLRAGSADDPDMRLLAVLLRGLAGHA